MENSEGNASTSLCVTSGSPPEDENCTATSPTTKTRRGDPFEVELVNHIPALRSLARLLTRNEEVAADLTQDTLTKAWRARGSFTAGTNMRAWLSAIMRNHFCSEARRSWRQVPWDEQSAERIAGAGGEQLWAIEIEDTARAIGGLSKLQRDALILVGVGGLSNEDACAIIHCRKTALKSRVCRARQTVRSMLDGTAPLRSERSKRDAAGELLGQLQSLTTQAA